MTSFFRLKLIIIVCFASLIGCAVDEASDEDQAPRPLAPLIYTELPELTPAAAAVRERRLMRELVDPSMAVPEGRAGRRVTIRPAHDARALGQLVYDSLIQRDEAAWASTFISAPEYADLVHVEPAQALAVVDELQADSLDVWRTFSLTRASEAPQGGLGALFELRGLELGQGRGMDGKLVDGDKEGAEPVVQYWGNTLTLGLREAPEITFVIQLPKIVHAGTIRRLVMAAPATIDASLSMFVDAGLHLKPELLRSQEYPYPLAVGNFWRYRRYSPDGKGKTALRDNAMGMIEDAESFAASEADEVILEILSVERYHSVRLVRYRRSYNDAELTKREGYWLMTPRALFSCSRLCVRHVGSIDRLVSQLGGAIPLYRFPLRAHDGWGRARGGRASSTPQRVASTPREIEVPAGTFIRALDVHSKAPAPMSDPFVEPRSMTRSFAPGQGVVRREIQGRDRATGEERVIVEELLEARIIMP